MSYGNSCEDAIDYYDYSPSFRDWIDESIFDRFEKNKKEIMEDHEIDTDIETIEQLKKSSLFDELFDCWFDEFANDYADRLY